LRASAGRLERSEVSEIRTGHAGLARAPRRQPQTAGVAVANSPYTLRSTSREIAMPDQLPALLVAALLLAGWLLVYWWTYRPRPSDVQAINNWAAANQLRVISIDHYWRQLWWMRRGLSLSTFARFYLVMADRPGCASRQEIYVAFDPLRPGELKALEKASTE
jgi:hypothetical protein